MSHTFNDFTADEVDALRQDLCDYAYGAMAELLRRVDPTLSTWEALTRAHELVTLNEPSRQ